ncbi:MAG: DUF3667 domain-containing protein [Saprospiraceae bacterium]
MEEQDEALTPKPPKPRCKNCGGKLSKQGSFCPGCGQRDFDGRIRMRDLLGKFFANFTHLDNKFLKMAWHLFVPARVTLNYFQGKIKRYPHPVQFFFIVMFFFLLMFSKQFDDAAINLMDGSFSVGDDKSYSVGDKTTVSKSNLYAALQRCMTAKEYRTAYDSLPTEWRNETSQKALDSIHRTVSEPWEQATQGLLTALQDSSGVLPSTLDTISLNFGISNVRIATTDFVGMEPDSIIKKYGFSNWGDKVMVKQSIKSIKDQQGLIHRYVGSLGWAILVLISFMALVLWLLYWRRGGYYVEHFIFLMHQQSGMYLLFALAMAVDDYLLALEWFWLVVLAWAMLSMLFAMKRFYSNNWAWTIVKWLAYTALYLLGLIVLFIAALLVVFVVF